MNRSVSARNLVGGFLGGVAGILASWYVDPMFLPLGVLLGVVAGWWMEDIAQAFVLSYQTAQRAWHRLVSYIIPGDIRLSYYNFFKYVGAFVTFGKMWLEARVSLAFGYMITPFRWLITCVRASVRVPGRFMLWASHPSSVAFLISISAVGVGTIVTAIAFGMLWPWPETMTIGGGIHNEPAEIVPFAFSDIVFITTVVSLLLSMIGSIRIMDENSDGRVMSVFYSRWERYSRHSPASYFARELFGFFQYEVRGVAYFAMTVIYWVTFGGALIALAVIPAATFVTFMVTLYKIALRSAHWWCFGITLLITATSALVFYSSFDNEVFLWTIALCTGVISGILTEGMRRLGMWWSGTESGEHYLDIWYDDNKSLPFMIARPAWRKLAATYEHAGRSLFDPAF